MIFLFGLQPSAMARFAEFGDLLRRLREPRFRSAAALSKAVGLSTNYVSILERGEARPRSETVERLIRGLKLTAVDADKLRRAARLAGEPEAVRWASAGPAIPNLAIWKHLPELLFRVEHGDVATWELAFDDMLGHVVPALSSALAWLTLCKRPPTRRQTDRLRQAARTAFDASYESFRAQLPSDDPGLAVMDAASILPRAWRNELFAEQRSAAKVVRLLKSWSYYPEGWQRGPARLGAHFKDPEIEQRCRFEDVPADSVYRVHDAMVAHRLRTTLGLADPLGRSIESQQEWELKRVAARLWDEFHEALDAVKAKRDSDNLPVSTRLGYARERVKLALRLYELPDLAGKVLPCSKDELLGALAAAAEVLHDPDPRHDS